MCIAWKKCCCCISLEVGAQIIAIFAIVGAIVNIAQIVYRAAFVYYPDDLKADVYVQCALAAVGVVELTAALLLARGVFGKRPSLLWPWVVVSWLGALAQLAAQAARLALQGPQATHAGLYLALVGVHSVLLMYCACVVHSRRQQMVREYYASPVRFARRDSYEKRLYVPVTTYEYKA